MKPMLGDETEAQKSGASFAADTLILKTHPTELCVAPSALPRAPSGHGRCSKYEGSSGYRESATQLADIVR